MIAHIYVKITLIREDLYLTKLFLFFHSQELVPAKIYFTSLCLQTLYPVKMCICKSSPKGIIIIKICYLIALKGKSRDNFSKTYLHMTSVTQLAYFTLYYKIQSVRVSVCEYVGPQ